MGSYKGDLSKTKLLQQSRKYGQPKGLYLISFAVAMKNHFCRQDVKLVQLLRDKDTARMSGWERIMGGSRPWRGTLPQLAESQWDELRHRTQKCKEVCRAGGSSGWKERGKLVFFIHSKICHTSPPSQITGTWRTKETDFLKVACLF